MYLAVHVIYWRRWYTVPTRNDIDKFSYYFHIFVFFQVIMDLGC
jgi:hypothetical protein